MRSLRSAPFLLARRLVSFLLPRKGADPYPMTSGEIRDCIVLLGPNLDPWRCSRFSWERDTVVGIDQLSPVSSVQQGALVIIPGLYNSHTHMGDSCLPDGATGLTLEQGFFRPNGFKYRELAKLSPAQHLPHVVDHLSYMARTGTICHLDFREQGVPGAQLLREASRQTGVASIILGQLDRVPFDDSALQANADSLPSSARQELENLLQVADGFSESTMNDLTDLAWREVREMTTKRGKLRAIHCLENEGYRAVSLARTGEGDLPRALHLLAPHLIVHLTVANAAEIALLANSGTKAVLNPRANANLGLPLPPIRALLESGASLLLGTDNGLLNSPNLFAEMDFTYKVAKSQYGDAVHPDPAAILRMVTSNIAPLLGLDHPGCLATGSPASFVVLNFHQPHLRASRHIQASIVTRITPEDILATINRGRVLYQNTGFKF